MYRRCSELRFFGRWVLVLAVVLAVTGCAGQPVSSGASRAKDSGSAVVVPAPATPATVEVDEGIGFTVTEVVSMSSATRANHREALQRVAAEDYAAGIALLLDVVAQVPDSTGPYVDLGIAYGRAGQYDKAIDALESAVAATPHHPVAHNELGIAYRRAGLFGDARRSYERALEIFPGFHFARRNLAVLCDLYLADNACALANYQAYSASVPDDERADMWLADLKNRLAVGPEPEEG